MKHKDQVNILKDQVNILKDQVTYLEKDNKTLRNIKKFYKDNNTSLNSQLDKEQERHNYWIEQHNKEQVEAKYYQAELEKAHALIGRIVHQATERWIF